MRTMKNVLKLRSLQLDSPKYCNNDVRALRNFRELMHER